MRVGQTCVDCGKQAPEKEASSALISAHSGWRLSRERAADGEVLIEWRCPGCWREYKQRRAASAAADGTVPRPPSSHPNTTPPPPLSSSLSPPHDPFRPRPPSTPTMEPLSPSSHPPAPLPSPAGAPAGRRGRKPGF